MIPRIDRTLLKNPFRKPAGLTVPVAAGTVALAAAIAVGVAVSGPGQPPATVSATPAAAGLALSAGQSQDGHTFRVFGSNFTPDRTAPRGHQARVIVAKPVTRRTHATVRDAHHRSAHKKAAVSRRAWHPVFGVDSITGVQPGPGVHFVARYIAPGNPKSINRGELTSLQRHGTRVVLIWEHNAMDMLGGYSAGRWAAQQAQAGLGQLGIPRAPVYFCADFDATPQDQVAINNYLRGAASVIGHQRVGVYGGYWAVSRAFNAHVVRFGWQTYAWSGGQWDPRAALHQYSVNQYRAGVPVDLNVAVHRDYGAVYPRR